MNHILICHSGAARFRVTFITAHYAFFYLRDQGN